MQIEINGAIRNVPTHVSEIPLGKFIEWQDQHGRRLDDELKEIMSKEYADDFLREDAIDQHLDKEAIAWYSFFTGFDFSEVADSYNGAQVCDQYRVVRYLLNASEKEAASDLGPFDWQGEKWEIQNYKVTPDSPMTFNEIITSKEVVRQLHKMGKGHWESLLYLSAIFFRKQGEAFNKNFLHADSERLKLMYELPLSYALAVSFFLANCVIIWKNTLAFSKAADQIRMQSQK